MHIARTHLRYSHACVRIIVGACNRELLLTSLVINVMLEVSLSPLNAIHCDIDHSISVRMCSLAVQTLIIVVAQCLPIIVSFHAPNMIEVVIFKAKHCYPRLCINSKEQVVPASGWRRRSLEIDPDKSQLVHVEVDREQVIVAFVEVREALEVRSFGKRAIESI